MFKIIKLMVNFFSVDNKTGEFAILGGNSLFIKLTLTLAAQTKILKTKIP